jgi:S1-C subfamily serine protease
VVVHSAEGTARRLGVQMGDIVTSINAAPVRTMADFVRVTDTGALAQGAVIVRRDTQRLAFEFTGSPPVAQPAAVRGGAAPVVLPPPNAQF